MKTLFIEQAEKSKCIFGKIRKVTKKEQKVIININLKKAKLKEKIKIVKKVNEILRKEKIRQVAIEKELKKDIEFINLLHSYNINICNSKWILKKCTDQIVDLILKEKNEISICVNEVDMMIQEYIFKFAKEFKRINIITNHIGKFKKIEEKLYNEEGILLNVSNNRRKSLLNANLILNIDFPKELINEFSLYDKSTIINWDEPLIIRKKRFNGTIIEEIEINLDKEKNLSKIIDENKLKKYDERDICHAFEVIPTEISIN